MPRNTILYLGSYGTGNHGDEALLLAAHGLILKRRPDADFIVLSRASDLSSYMGMPVSHYGKGPIVNVFSNLFRMLLGAELLVLGGGGLFNDHFRGNLLYYGLAVLLARLAGCKVLFLGMGIGPFRNDRRRRLASWIMAMGNSLSVRDENSLSLLSGRAAKMAKLGTDLAWSFSQNHGDEPTPGILLSLRPWDIWNEDEVLDHVLALLIQLPPELPLRMIAMDDERDRGILSRVEASLPTSRTVEWIESNEVRTAFGPTQWVIAMRYHAALFAARSGAALHLIAYDSKLESLAKDLELESVWTPGEPMPEPSFEQASNEAIHRMIEASIIHEEIVAECLEKY